MATQIAFALSSTLASFGGIASGDSVTGGSNLTETNRLVSALAVGSVKQSYLADALAGSFVLSIGGTLTAARTLTTPDASLTVAGQNYANVFTVAQIVRVAGGLTVQQASTQDAIAIIGRAGGTSSYVATLTPGTMAANATLTLPVSTTTIAGLAIAQTWTQTQAFAAISATSITDSGLTSGRVTFASTAGLLADSSLLLWSSPNFSVGGTALTTFNDSVVTPALQVLGTTASMASIGAACFSATAATGPRIVSGKSKGATIGDYTAVAAADTLLTLQAQGSDGTDFSSACSLIVTVDAGATVSAGIVPGRISLRTTTAAGSNTQAMAIDSNQVVIIGNSTVAGSTVFTGGTTTPRLQSHGTSANVAGASQTLWAASAVGPTSYLSKSRSATIGTMTIVNTGDTLGTLDWQGADGTNFVSAARIIVTATGTPASGVMPGNMVFQTASAAGTLTTALTITNAQAATFAGAVTVASMTNSALTSGRIPVASTAGLMADFSTFTYASGSGISVDGITMADAKNFAFNTSTGSKIGTATGQKIGFWNATPIIQPAGATQAAPAAYVTGAFGLDSDANMHALYDLVVAIRTALVNSGIMKGAA